MKKCKKQTRDIGFIILGIYGAISLIMFLVGVQNSQSDYFYTNLKCDSAASRIEYLFPAYRFGCYMGSEPEKECK